MAEEPPRLGRRERNKTERRKRIDLAARAVFEEKGFDHATTREIAERADVSSATLFAYASEKRQLLLMLYRDDLWSMNDRAFTTLPVDAPLLVQLEHIFQMRYAFWAQHPELSRHVTLELSREIAPEVPLERSEIGYRNAFLALREKIASLLSEHQRAGAFPPDIAPGEAARIIMHVYLSEQRTWLNEPKPDVPRGMTTLLHYLAVLLRGFIGDKK